MLNYDEATGAFYLHADNDDFVKAAKAIGMDHSIPASQRMGYPVYLTHEPHAALPLYEVAAPSARDRLFSMQMEYEASKALECSYQPPAPPGMEYMPFQSAGIRYGLDRTNFLIGDQPGTGKTVSAVGFSNAIGAEKILVLCPASVRPQWVKHIADWSTIRRVRSYPVMKSADGVSPFANYTVISYDLARIQEIHHALMAFRYDLLILDEAHYLKTTDARRTRATFGGLRQVRDEKRPAGYINEFGYSGDLAERSERILALTGTPLPNRPRECYNLARHLCWDAIDWQSEEAFKHRYNPSFTWPSGRIEERKGRLPELRARLRCNFMVRRLKKDVLPQLPEEQYELTYIEPNGAIKKVLRAESMLEVDPDCLEEINAKIWGQISTVRKEMGIAKVPRVVEHIKMLLDGGLEKVLVAIHHREVADQLEVKLASYGVVVINGGTTPVQKEKRKQQFINNPDIKVCLGQFQACGVGTDGLQQSCFHIVLAEASWVWGDNEQIFDRLHRHGQRFPVFGQFLVAPGSLDERIIGKAIEKFHTTHETLDGD